MKRTWYYKVYPRDGQKGVRHYYYDASGWVMDHVLPIALGGNQYDFTNLQTLCPECNKTKTRTDLSNILYEKYDVSRREREENLKKEVAKLDRFWASLK